MRIPVERYPDQGILVPILRVYTRVSRHRARIGNAPMWKMSSVKVNGYRAALQEKLTELEASVRRLDDIAVETVPDAMDDSAFANARDIAIEQLEQRILLLKSVRSAIDRIPNGRFGVCLGCGEMISPKRLAVLPWAVYCRPCQESADAIEDPRFEQLSVSGRNS